MHYVARQFGVGRDVTEQRPWVIVQYRHSFCTDTTAAIASSCVRLSEDDPNVTALFRSLTGFIALGLSDVYKARRRVYTLEPEWRFALPSAVEFDSRNSRLMVADTQRWRIQIYNKLHDYADPQFNI